MTAVMAVAQTAKPGRADPSTSFASRLAAHLLGGLLLFSAIMPLRYGAVKAGWLLATLAIALVLAGRFPARLARNALVILAFGTVWTAVGITAGNPGANAAVSVFVVTPTILAIALPLILIRSAAAVSVLDVYLAIAAIAIGSLTLALFFLPDLVNGLLAPLYATEYTQVEREEGYLATNYQAVNSLIFLAPFLCVRALTARSAPASATIVVQLGAILSVVASLISGRAALLVALPAGLAAGLGLHLVRVRAEPQPPRGRRLSTFTLLALFAGLLLGMLGLRGSALLRPIVGAQTLIGIDDVRRVQARILLEEFWTSPLLGHGHGHAIPVYARDPLRPWSFELTYHVLLMNMGLIGLLGLVLFVAAIYRNLALPSRIRMRGLHAAAAAGLTGSLVASASNPYLFKFDGLWLLFLPYAIGFAVRYER